MSITAETAIPITIETREEAGGIISEIREIFSKWLGERALRKQEKDVYQKVLCDIRTKNFKELEKLKALIQEQVQLTLKNDCYIIKSFCIDYEGIKIIFPGTGYTEPKGIKILVADMVRQLLCIALEKK